MNDAYDACKTDNLGCLLFQGPGVLSLFSSETKCPFEIIGKSYVLDVD